MHDSIRWFKCKFKPPNKVRMLEVMEYPLITLVILEEFHLFVQAIYYHSIVMQYIKSVVQNHVAVKVKLLSFSHG